MRATMSVLGVAVFVVAGCAGSRDAARGFESRLPAERHAAMRDPAATDVAAAVRSLIEQLDHADGSVRLAAIDHLERRAGTRMGYRFDDPPHRREEAMSRWLAWYHETHATASEAGGSGAHG